MINLLTITGTGDVSSQNDFEVIETVFIAIIIKFCTGKFCFYEMLRYVQIL